MPDSAASPLPSPPASRPHSVTDHHSAFSHPHPHPHPRSHPLDHAPRTGSPLARRKESSGTRVQFADDPGRSRSPSIERISHPGRINDMPTGSLSAAMAARAGSPSLTSPPPQQLQPGLPPQRRLSSRRGSMAAVDPWGKHYNEEDHPRTSTSRLTIVRVPNTSAIDEDPHGHSPSPGPYGGSSSFRERSHQRRSSWGANSGSDGEGGGGDGRKRSRVSFAFSSFTPISPTPVSARQGPPQRTGSPGIGSGFATSFGPAQSRARTRSIGSTGGVDISSHNPTQNRSGARQAQLSAQQLYDLAMASRDPAAPQSTPVQGVSAAVEPAHFTALPEGEILPFLDRPGEVEALINTPGTQSHKLFTLLGVLFPRPKEDGSAKEEAEDEATAPTPKAQISQPMWPPFPGEARGEKSAEVPQPPSPIPVPPSKAAPAQHPLGLPSQPTQWTYAQLITHLTQTTREQLPDKEWVLFARACIRNRSEALWERVKGCLGVPNDIYEEDFEDEDEEESPIGPVGISDLANLSPVARFKALRDNEGAVAGSDRALSDDEHEPEAWIEPVFSGGPGSARGSVSNSPTNYFTGSNVTGLGGGRGDSKSWAGSVSGRSDGGRMELIGEEEEEEEGQDDKNKNGPSTPADKTPEPDSPVVGLRIMTAPMSPGFHSTHASSSSLALAGTSSPTPGTGDTTPSAGIPVPSTGSGAASPTPASPSPSIHQFLGPPMPKARGGAWISPLSNTISTGGRGLSGMGRSGAGWNSPMGGSGSGSNSPVGGGGGGGWNSPLSHGHRGSRGAWNPATERGPGNPIFPSSFARLSLGPTLIANNPNHRNPVPASAYPPFRYLRERYKWARPASENDFAVTIASESSDAGGRY